MATHSSILTWRIPWTEETGGLHSMGSQRVGHDQMTNTFTFSLSLSSKLEHQYSSQTQSVTGRWRPELTANSSFRPYIRMLLLHQEVKSYSFSSEYQLALEAC